MTPGGGRNAGVPWHSLDYEMQAARRIQCVRRSCGAVRSESAASVRGRRFRRRRNRKAWWKLPTPPEDLVPVRTSEGCSRIQENRSCIPGQTRIVRRQATHGVPGEARPRLQRRDASQAIHRRERVGPWIDRTPAGLRPWGASGCLAGSEAARSAGGIPGALPFRRRPRRKRRRSVRRPAIWTSGRLRADCS